MRRENSSFRNNLVIAGLLLGLSWGTAYSEETKYLMQEGDTLYGVARKYNVPVDAILQLNGIANPAKLQRGASILIPEVYTVKKGDSLYAIAKQWDLSIETLAGTNNLKTTTLLKPGTTLFIPKKGKITAGKAETKEQPEKAEKQEKPVSPQIVATPSVTPKPAAAQPAATQPAVNTPKKTQETKDPFWPHTGPKKTMDGKLEGLAFEGNPGDPVYSIATGKVVWVGPYRGFGRVVFVQSEEGYIYVYAGNEELFVVTGDQVKRGQKLGTLGVHPYEQKSSLYFIVYKDGKAIRPEDAPRT